MGNKYLEKIALRRVVEELAKGKVAAPLESLVAKGFIKSPKVYAKGMREGNAALAQRFGAKISASAKEGSLAEMLTNAGGGAAALARPGGSVVHHDRLNMGSAGLSKTQKSLSNSAMIRHELFEGDELRQAPLKGASTLARKAREIKKNLGQAPLEPKTLGRLTKTLTHKEVMSAPPTLIGRSQRGLLGEATYRELKNTFANDPAVLKSLRGSSVVGGHMSPMVLGREANMIRQNPHLQGGYMQTMRADHGEDELLKRVTGKEYGKDRFTGTDLKKLRDVKPNSLLSSPDGSKVRGINIDKIPAFGSKK